MTIDEINQLIAKTIGDGGPPDDDGYYPWDYGGHGDDLRAVARAAYEQGCKDTARDVSDAELIAVALQRKIIEVREETLRGMAGGDDEQENYERNLDEQEFDERSRDGE